MLAQGGVLWSKLIAGTVFYATYEERGGRKHSSVRRSTPGIGTEEIWTSTKFVPANVQQAGGGLFLDVWGGGRREILYLSSAEKTKERVVWSEESSVLWK